VIVGVSGTAAAVIVIVLVNDDVTDSLPPVSWGVVAWLVVIKRLPEALPIATGANLPVKVALCPSANVNGSDGPVTTKPPPDAIALVTV
jgi:hypothetical protein